MKISREEFKNIRYICKKFKISRESFHIKTLAATLDKRLLRRRFILCSAVKHTRTGHFLVWNTLKRIDIRNKFLKKNSEQHKHKHIKTWRRAVRKVRKSESLGTIEETQESFEAEEGTQQVRDKLKEQLQLLQLGKKNKFIDEGNVEAVCNGKVLSRKSSVKSEEADLCGECFDDNEDMESLRVTPDITSECGSDIKEEKEQDKDAVEDHTTPVKDNTEDTSDKEETQKLSDTGYNSPSMTPSKKGFLDSLLNKFKTTDSEKTTKDDKVEEELVEDKLPQPVLIPLAVEPGQRTTRMRARKAIHQVRSELEEAAPSSSSPKKDKVTPKGNLFNLSGKEVPGLLATPKAKNTKASAFVDQESAEEVKIKLEKVEDEAQKNFDQKEHEGLVCAGIKPPHLEKPKKLMDLERPRTVAEKRQLMQKKKGIKFLMMENESKIFNELAKISREDCDHQFNFPILTALQKETVPYRRDAWRALSFLKTEKNRFFYKVVYIDGVKCNLLGCRGNFDGKKKFKATSAPFPKYLAYRSRNPCCKPIRIPKNMKFNLDIPREKPEEPVVAKKLLDFDKTMLNMKPGPLSQKLRKQTSRLSTDECLGPLELYTMPTVELEVRPKIGRQLDPKIHPYLKYLLPHENITETWARFSVSLLQEHEKETGEAMFSFPIPYSNNQNKIMIRRRKQLKQNISIEDKALAEDIEKPLTFTNSIKPDDTLGQEIGQILTEMTNSVAIGLSDSCFIQSDPDLDYTKADKPIEAILVKSVKETSLSKRIVRELRKLNATFITADNQSTKCTEKYCEKGCVCESLTTSIVFKNHCNKQECMLSCKCAPNRYHVNDEIKDCSFTSDEVQSLRAKATARLAPIEKDFTPTLVLSNNSTYLIPGSDREHTRRSKKVPKRFSDFVDSSKVMTGVAEDTSEIMPVTALTKSKYTPKDPLEAAIYQMKHCGVVLRPLPHVNQIEPWCMVHCLYKCFCNGQATEGKPFTFDDLEEGLQERFDYGIRKPRYEFEKHDMKENAALRNRRLSSSTSSANETLIPPASPSSSRQSIDLDLFDFDTDIARRCFPIDEKYKIRNPRETNLKKLAIKKYEQRHPNTEQLLQKRLIECEQHFHRELRKWQLRKGNVRKSTDEVPMVPEKSIQVLPKRPKHRLSRPIRLNIENSEEEIEAFNILKPLVSKNVILIATGKNKIYAKKDYFYAGKLDFTKVMQKAKSTIFIIEKTLEEEANNYEFLRTNKMIRRTKLVDVKLILNIILKPGSQSAEEITVELNSSQDDDFCSSQASVAIETPEMLPEVGAQKVQHINTMISKAMQYICKLQKQNSPKLVEPTQSKMYFFTWKCMMQGFQQNLLSVWEIKCTGNRCAVVVTQEEQQPIIEFMEEMKNIRKCTAETPGLSLYSKMLLLKVDSDKTKNLSLVLYGGSNFWRITGFVNSENDYQQNGVIARPTPQTHPILSAKINNLFNFLHNRNKAETDQAMEELTNTKFNSKTYKTNIKICSTENMPSIRSLFLPIPEVPDQRWFMLQIENDFSDIFIPNWNDYLSYDKVTYALALAKEHSKTVRVTMNDKFPEIYATSRRSNCIFFGPYGMRDNVDYILCQNVDGEIVDRESYEKKFNITKDKATIGSWLYPKRDGDSTSQEGEPSPKIRKIISKIGPKPKKDEPLPFIISQVQTAITDPNLIPIIDSSDDDNSKVKKMSLKRVSVDAVSTNPEKRQKTDEPPKPLKVTLLRQEGEGYAIKTSPGITLVKGTQEAAKRVSLPGSSTTDHQLMGKRISLPLSAVRSMKPMVLQKRLIQPVHGVSSLLKPVPLMTQKLTTQVTPGTSSETKNNILVRPMKKFIQKIAVKTPTGVQIKSIIRQTAIPEKVPETIKTEKTNEMQKVLPSSVSVSSIVTNDKPLVKVVSSQKPVINNATVVPVIPQVTQNPTSSTNAIVPSLNSDAVSGFYISEIISIGRIIAEKRGNKLTLKMRNCDGYYVRRQFMAGQSTQYLNRYLRGFIHSFIPDNYVLTWRFETLKEIVDKYPEHDPNKVPRKMIITKHGGIPIKQTWDQLAYIEPLDKNQYLKILLIKLADDCFPDQKFPKWDVLEILQTSQKEIERLEKQTPALVQARNDEHKRKSELLKKLAVYKQQNPSVELPTSVPGIELSEEADSEGVTKEFIDDDVEIISVQKKGIEVICLDDDED